jgi:hypothetical protein
MVGIVNIPPLPITVAIKDSDTSINDCCTKPGFIPLTLLDRSIHWQIIFFCVNAAKTIISPQAILASSNVFVSWMMTGFKHGRPGSLCFDSHDRFLHMALTLICRDGLYYCPTDVFTIEHSPVCANTFQVPAVAMVLRVIGERPQSIRQQPSRYKPTTKERQLESEVWLLRLGSPGVDQLDNLPQLTTSLPPVFDYHPFCFIDFKEQARIRKQAAQRSSVRTTERQRRFYMDFGFMRALASDYSRPDKIKDCVVHSYDGFSSYLLVIDEASQYVWIFLTASKEPPTTIVKAFLAQHCHANGGCVRTDQGGELAKSPKFRDLLLRKCNYTIEPTGANSPSQNWSAEIYNDKFAV